MNIVAVAFSVAVLLALLVVVVRRAIVQDFRTARRGGMSSTSADRRRPSARLRLLTHVALGVFAVALALYLAVATLAGRGAYEVRLAVAYLQVASLAAAALLWFTARWAARRERRADRRWAARLAAAEAVTKPRGA